MGLFDAFRKKREPAGLTLPSLPPWLDEKEEAAGLEAIRRDAAERSRELAAHLKDAIERLSAMKPHDASVLDHRTLALLEGNRRSAVQRLTKFLDKGTIGNDKEPGEELSRLRGLLDTLDLETKKNSLVLDQLLSDGIGAVGRVLTQYRTFIGKTEQRLSRSGLSDIRQARTHLSAYTRALADDDAYRRQEHALRGRMKEAREKEEHAREALAALPRSEGYRAWQEARAQCRELEAAKDAAARQIVSWFAAIAPAMKKYAKVSMEDTLSPYLSDPAKALQEDRRLAVAEALGKMRKALPTLGLKASKGERIAAILASDVQRTLERLRAGYLSAAEAYEQGCREAEERSVAGREEEARQEVFRAEQETAALRTEGDALSQARRLLHVTEKGEQLKDIVSRIDPSVRLSGGEE